MLTLWHDHSLFKELAVKFTPSPIITLGALITLVLCADPALCTPRSSSAAFDATFRSYQALSDDPRGTRDQWLRVVRSFVAIHHKTKMSETGRRSLFFAGRACLSLYRRSGKKADLDEAIWHLDRFVRMHRSGPYLILGLQELKEAHLLKRRFEGIHANPSPRQPVRAATQGTIDRKARGQERFRVEPTCATQRGAVPASTAYTRPQAVSSPASGTVPAEPARRQISGPRARSIENRILFGTRDAETQAPARVPAHGTSVCSSFNCTGNPFFQGPLEHARRATQPIRSASLSPATMNDAPRLVRPKPAATPPAAAPSPESQASDAPVEESSPKAPADDSVDAARQDEAVASPCNQVPEKYVVVIDPGHGGKDPGAQSNDGRLKEKDVTLKVAKRMKVLLERMYPGITVALTRSEDAFLPLQERTAFANSLNADLFVSVHCNAAEDASSRGIETYYLSKASSKEAMASAARENGIPANRMSDIDTTLLDLLMDSKKSESVKLAETVHQALIHTVAGTNSLKRNRGVKRAPFYVLLGAKMPAILIECGFINGRERDSLKEPSFLDSLAVGITEGIGHYLQGLGDKG